MSITAKEIAEKLGLSATAVSMALRNKPGVSEETRAQVLHMAEQCGYDFRKKTENKKKSGSVYFITYTANGAIVSYTAIFAELLEGIKNECRKDHLMVKSMQVYQKTDNLEDIFSELRGSDCVGIILLATEASEEICRRFQALRLPLILLDTHFYSINCSSVVIDNIQGAYMAADHLLQNNRSTARTDILTAADLSGSQNRTLPGHLQSAVRIQNFEERRMGFHRALKDNGLSAAGSITHLLSPSIEGAMTDMLEIIDSGAPLAGSYFADNDILAIGAMRAFLLRGYKIPDDVSFVGFDNIHESKVIAPSLTTIDVPRFYMGAAAARQLLLEMNEQTPHAVTIQVSTRLIKRFSV